MTCTSLSRHSRLNVGDASNSHSNELATQKELPARNLANDSSVQPIANVDAALLRVGTLGVLEMSGLSSSLTVLAKRPEGAEGGGGGWVWEVAASHRQHGVGGESLDGALVEHLVRDFREAHGIDLSADHLALVRLHEAAEAAILALCSSPSVPVSLPFITADASGPKHLEQTLSRAALERLIEPALAAAIDALPAALADASPAPQGATAEREPICSRTHALVPEICPRYARDMPEVYPRGVPEIYLTCIRRP